MLAIVKQTKTIQLYSTLIVSLDARKAKATLTNILHVVGIVCDGQKK